MISLPKACKQKVNAEEGEVVLEASRSASVDFLPVFSNCSRLRCVNYAESWKGLQNYS